VIFNATANQWGAYSYDSSRDMLRFKVKPARTENRMETFTIQFANMFNDHGDLQLLWENTAVIIPISTDVDARVMTNIDKAMQGEKKPYYFAAIYYYNHDKDLQKALVWMREREKAQPKAYNVKYWIGKIQLKLGDKAGAIESANAGLKLALAEPNPEYIRMNKEVLAEAQGK